MSHCLTRCIVISCWLKHICVLTSLSEQIMKLCVLTENSRSQHFAIDSLEGRCRCQHFPCRNAGKLQLSLVLMPTFWALYNSSVGIRLTRFMSCLPVDHLRWDVVRCFQNYNRDVSVDGILINTHFETNKHIVWQPRRAADTSTNWRQSLLCCCTASMEQATDGAETAAINRLVSSWSENISVSFCLWASGYGLTLWCTLGLLVGGAIQVPQLQLQLRYIDLVSASSMLNVQFGITACVLIRAVHRSKNGKIPPDYCQNGNQ